MSVKEIDQDLYNRQIYVLGNQAMHKLTNSNVFLYGLGPLGIEIAKNLVLAGIGSLTVIDNKLCDLNDVGGQFFIKEQHLANNLTRAQASLDQLKQLNPYVHIRNEIDKTMKDIDAQFIKQFDCVIISEQLNDVNKLFEINETCRQQSVRFLFTSVVGLFGFSFTDFGDQFEVNDTDGEEYREEFIGNMSNHPSDTLDILIETQSGKLHNLETNDLVRLSEILNDDGAKRMNGQIFEIEVVDAKKFKLKNFKAKIEQQNSGMFKKVKKNIQLKFESLKSQLVKPSIILCDLSEEKYSNPYLNHLLIDALISYNVSSKNGSYEEFHDICQQKFLDFNLNNSNLLNENHKVTLSKMSQVLYLSKSVSFTPLCAIFGGIVAQEALKSITNKFMPIQQWIHLEFSDLNELFTQSFEQAKSVYSNLNRKDRYDYLRICFGGNATLEKLRQTKLFMVGCGAIGCEMLKNYALLGVASTTDGLITITDNDLIEKSNLNRQFLFRQSDIQKAKSTVASQAILKINSDVNIKAMEHKVCAQTEQEHFSDTFFALQDVCVNALDNVEARRYMDSRCVVNQKPLLESGTLGSKGHVQVIVPHITESYTSQKDPNDNGNMEIPYCTLKSFPSNIEHCIQWARDKFESVFKIKPTLFEKFLQENHDLAKLVSLLSIDENLVIENSVKVSKFMSNYCFTWEDCLVIARYKFEKYFCNKAKDLLHAYPLDHLMNDGSAFWKLPKRPPKALAFNSYDKLHLDFVISFARLLAQIFQVEISSEQLRAIEEIRQILDRNESKVPKWKPVQKHIETDETKKKEESNKVEASSKEMDNKKAAEIIKNFMTRAQSNVNVFKLDFEKDDDTNGHIDFILATANLRAQMYSIETSDKLHVKKIAGKIVPAIATTTACIAGFVTIELIKLVQNGEWKLEKFRNLFLNLGISFFLMSEPGPCVKAKIAENCYVSLWDKWNIKGTEKFTLKNFIDSVKSKYKLTVSGVIYGSKPIYIPVMPGHAKRLNETMLKLTKGATSLASAKLTMNDYVDLHLTYEECDKEENRDQNNLCPPIRYYFC